MARLDVDEEESGRHSDRRRLHEASKEIGRMCRSTKCSKSKAFDEDTVHELRKPLS